MSSGGLGYYTWQDYPADVPVDRRRPCIVCGAPGEVVRYQHVDRFGTQLSRSGDQVALGDPTAADGILDRLVHNAHRIEMRGDSMRKKRGPQPSS